MPLKGAKKDKKTAIIAGHDPVTGRFVKGYGGGGRPKMPEELKTAFRARSMDALIVLVKILNDEEARNSDRIRAAEIILDRGYGKPVQAVDLDGNSIPQVVIVGDVPD